MKVVSKSTVYGAGGGPIPPGEKFDIPDDDPDQLLSRGIVKPAPDEADILPPAAPDLAPIKTEPTATAKSGEPNVLSRLTTKVKGVLASGAGSGKGK